MSKALRLSEKWFRRGLWLVAFVFASFLIGLGGTVVRNLPQVEHSYSLEDFIDRDAATQARNAIKRAAGATPAMPTWLSARAAMTPKRIAPVSQRRFFESSSRTYARRNHADAHSAVDSIMTARE